MRRADLPPAVAVMLMLSGCYDWRAAVVHTAAFEHHCDERRVRILGDDGDRMARSVHLDVCGSERTYRGRRRGARVRVG
jgi:hypothetical protein